jgi:autotransporter translocation and assembly factor TamB
VGIETASSALLAKGRLGRDGAIVDAIVRGRLAFADVRDLFPERVRPQPSGAMQVLARVEGTLTTPSAHVEVDAKALELELPALHPLPFRDVNARLLVDRQRLVIRALRGHVHGGEVNAEGLVGWSDSFRGTQWRVRFGGVRTEDVALDRERTLGRWIAGTMMASVTMEQRGQGPLAGGGELRVDAPVYHALTQLTPTLGRHGVSTPSPHGVAPLLARFGFGERGVRFEGIELRVDGALARGTVTVDWTKILSGRLDVDLAERLVRNSALLGIPAMLTSTIRLVVNLTGTIDDPSARVDPLETLGVADAVATVRSAFEGLFPTAQPQTPEDAELDSILDRILDHDPRSEELIASLVDRGIDPDEFERLLARRRARRKR